MQGKHLFEYAVIRIVPKVEREEFLNAGVVLYCRDKKFLQSKMYVNEDRVRAFCEKISIEELQQHLDAFDAICKGEKTAGPIAALDIASRFRWLTAKRSTIVQSSQVHPGLCVDADETLDRLFGQLVL
ncbi:MAG: DUF3037 domain-containing protein [Sphingobacteriales bacterium]|nr:MAG: DUF3037 domain-containing protein [Sphingobacteriales bacterium]